MPLQGDTSRAFTGNDSGVWHHQIDMRSSKNSEQLILNTLQITGPGRKMKCFLHSLRTECVRLTCRKSAFPGPAVAVSLADAGWDTAVLLPQVRTARHCGAHPRVKPLCPPARTDLGEQELA